MNDEILQIFKICRYLRMLRLIKFWTRFKQVLILMKEAFVDEIWPLLIYFRLFLIAFSLIGREWFGYKA